MIPVTPIGLLRALGWIACGIYTTIPVFWMLVHPFVDLWRVARIKFKMLGAWWVFIWIVAWAITWPWSQSPLYRIPRLWLLTPLFWSASLFLYFSGGSGLSLRRVIGTHEVEPQATPDTLVTQGIYSHVRNPIYLGHCCTMLGWSFATSTIACWAMTLFYFVTLVIMLPMEERELRQRFGTAYEEYCKQVPRLIPRFQVRGTSSL